MHDSTSAEGAAGGSQGRRAACRPWISHDIHPEPEKGDRKHQLAKPILMPLTDLRSSYFSARILDLVLSPFSGLRLEERLDQGRLAAGRPWLPCAAPSALVESSFMRWSRRQVADQEGDLQITAGPFWVFTQSLLLAVLKKLETAEVFLDAL